MDGHPSAFTAACMASTTTMTQAATIVCQQNQHQHRVIAVNKSAEKGGIRTNMALSTARTLVPQVHVLDRDLQAERLAIELLATFGYCLVTNGGHPT